MAQSTPARNTKTYEVTYVPKGTKMHVTEYVTAHNEAHVRCLVRSTEGMVKFVDIHPCEAVA